jgi:hypothetical protein
MSLKGNLMKNKTGYYCLIILLILACSGIVWAAKHTLGQIEPGVYPMEGVTNHIPSLYKRTADYWNSLRKVQLEVGNLSRFKDVPKLGLKNPYTGVIELGDKPQRFGVIVDIVGEEKRLYVDTNGDGSFKDENWVPLINEWYGNQNYWIIAPEPIKLMVRYQAKSDQAYPIEIAVNGALIDSGSSQKVKPFLAVEVRTWFLAKVTEDGVEKLMAVIDSNHNGCFNDPEDQFLIDYNDDGFFTLDEALARKKGITLKSGKQKLNVDWDVYPDSLKIGGQEQ